MAIDTEDKRMSMLSWHSGRRVPQPDGAFEQNDRQTLLGRYGGIAWATPIAEVIIDIANTIVTVAQTNLYNIAGALTINRTVKAFRTFGLSTKTSSILGNGKEYTITMTNSSTGYLP